MGKKGTKYFEPDRTDSNIRTYNETELKKILNVAYLNKRAENIKNCKT